MLTQPCINYAQKVTIAQCDYANLLSRLGKTFEYITASSLAQSADHCALTTKPFGVINTRAANVVDGFETRYVHSFALFD
jgi:hypothetical protein